MRFVLLLLLAALPLQGSSPCNLRGLSSYQRCCNEYWQSTLDLDGLFYADWRQQGTATLFLPFFQPGCNVFFAQGTAGRFKHMWVGSAGGGFRSQLSENFGWGINAFADYGRSGGKADWWQFGFGAEAFGGNWEARVNAYIPGWFNDRIVQDDVIVINEIVGNQILTFKSQFLRFEKARWGFDCEGGLGAYVGPGALWGLAGFFRFEGQGLPILQGPRARLEYRIDLPLQWGIAEAFAGGEWQHDQVFGQQLSLRLHIAIPLGMMGGRPRRCCLTTVCRQMGRAVRRQTGVVIRERSETFRTNSQVGLWFIEENGVGVGSQADPTNLLDAITNSLQGDFIFALNNNGPITDLPAGATLKNDQSLYAFPNSDPITLDLGDGNSITVSPLMASNVGGTIMQGAVIPNVNAAFRNLIYGITLDGGQPGINASHITDLTVNLATLQNQTDAGLFLDQVSGDITVTNSHFKDVTGSGILLINNNSNATFTSQGNIIEDTAGGNTDQGIAFSLLNTSTLTFDIQDTTFSSLLGPAIHVSKRGSGGFVSGVIANNTIEDNSHGLGAVQLLTDPTAANAGLAYNITGNTITSSTGPSFFANFEGAAGGGITVNMLFDQNTVSKAGGAAFDIDYQTPGTNDTSAIAFTNNNVEEAAMEAFLVRDASPGTLNLTFTSNDDAATTGTDIAYSVTNSGSGTTCATLTGNNTSRGMGDAIVLDKSGTGTFEVTDKADVSANNNNVDVVQTGTVNRASPCPTPTVPDIPTS